MPRKARLDAPGTLHHVIIRGIERKKIVSDDKDRNNFVIRMGTIALETDTKIYAWALMPNHAHILLRSSQTGLSGYMRRLLSGYATWYNRRHGRHGHLFQNRYKSIVCEEDPYFTELVRYIHLNPLRADIVQTLKALDSYKYCGHSVVMGIEKNDWQARDEVLRWFGATMEKAEDAYRQFLKNGIDMGRRPELIGGGLIRSQGGWSAVKSMRKLGLREKSDERILGSGEFVDRLIEQSDTPRKIQFSDHERSQRADQCILESCAKARINREALKSGSRRREISAVRSQLAKTLVIEIGLSHAETSRYLGVTASAIAKILNRSQASMSPKPE